MVWSIWLAVVAVVLLPISSELPGLSAEEPYKLMGFPHLNKIIELYANKGTSLLPMYCSVCVY